MLRMSHLIRYGLLRSRGGGVMSATATRQGEQRGGVAEAPQTQTTPEGTKDEGGVENDQALL